MKVVFRSKISYIGGIAAACKPYEPPIAENIVAKSLMTPQGSFASKSEKIFPLSKIRQFSQEWSDGITLAFKNFKQH